MYICSLLNFGKNLVGYNFYFRWQLGRYQFCNLSIEKMEILWLNLSMVSTYSNLTEFKYCTTLALG